MTQLKPTLVLACVVVTMALAGVARADPPAACWSAAALAGRPDEVAKHRPGPSDQVSVPQASPPNASVASPGSGVVRRVVPRDRRKLVALTFDLCEGSGEVAGYDGAIVDRLRALKVPATFFMGGRWAQSHEERAMQLLADPLFEVGDHTYDHADLAHADAARIDLEIARTEAVIGGLSARLAKTCPAAGLPPKTRLFRFPYGACGAEGPAAVRAAGLVPIQWDVVSGDPSGVAAAPMARGVLGEVKPGSIIVMHANGRGRHTAEALATIIPQLRARGYEFVTVSDLMAAGRPETSGACFIEHPGDTARYDHPKAVPTKTKGAGAMPTPSSE
ncbi:polysaccharide deacetylase family protein [Mesorhizobium sp. BR1-1-16]|uniref:polysaccharide deacetylase family protein n=1 Tax=Mesorhizobium sp. BR1-1-16 TaxID=2876653 RepID=UPI001CCA1DFB|nr:polysaccharide deacetylase family protein [Mesorhizobium sp. BR1-1-16]MBZ9935126.1 polysaccharide deacetylase family protein [Mesorhizobium sp. BR1-1-16]